MQRKRVLKLVFYWATNLVQREKRGTKGVDRSLLGEGGAISNSFSTENDPFANKNVPKVNVVRIALNL